MKQITRILSTLFILLFIFPLVACATGEDDTGIVEVEVTRVAEVEVTRLVEVEVTRVVEVEVVVKEVVTNTVEVVVTAEPTVTPDVVEVQDTSGEKVDVNEASLDQLTSLTGIGPTIAQRIIEGRPYAQVDDLINVKGIGDKKLDQIKDQVVVVAP